MPAVNQRRERWGIGEARMEYNVVQLLERTNMQVFNPDWIAEDIQREIDSIAHIKETRKSARDLVADAELLKKLESGFDTCVRASEKHIELLRQVQQEKKVHRDAIRKVLDGQVAADGNISQDNGNKTTEDEPQNGDGEK